MGEPELRRFHARTSAFFDEHPAGPDPRVLVAMIESDDVDTALFGIGLMHRWIADQEMINVFRARDNERSWGWIGERLGRTRQAVWERYRDRTEASPEQ